MPPGIAGAERPRPANTSENSLSMGDFLVTSLIGRLSLECVLGSSARDERRTPANQEKMGTLGNTLLNPFPRIENVGSRCAVTMSEG